jgi:hypothetical protein
MTTPLDETNPLQIIQTHRNAIQNEIEKLKVHLATKLGDAKITFNALTSPDVGVPAGDLLKDPQIAESLKSFIIQKEQATGSTKPKRTGSKKKSTTEKRKTVRDWIVELLSGGKEMTRPEIEAAIKEQIHKKPYNVHKYSGQLLNEGVLVESKPGTFKLK